MIGLWTEGRDDCEELGGLSRGASEVVQPLELEVEAELFGGIDAILWLTFCVLSRETRSSSLDSNWDRFAAVLLFAPR